MAASQRRLGSMVRRTMNSAPVAPLREAPDSSGEAELTVDTSKPRPQDDRAVVVVGVFDACPSRRQGLVHALVSAGFTVQSPDSALAWLHREEFPIAVLYVGDQVPVSFLGRLHDSRPSAALVVLVANFSAFACRQALRARATSVVASDADLDEIAAVVAAAARSQTLLPAAMVQALAAGEGLVEPGGPVSEVEQVWLRALGAGSAVKELAASAGYSEREMYRRLESLYHRLGASNRVEALLSALRRGFID